MKSFEHLYTSENGFKEFLYANKIDPNNEYLVRIHTCTHDCEDIPQFIQTIKKFIPNCKIAGSSTSAIIFKGKVMREKCLISITEFDNASVETRLVSLVDGDGVFYSGEALADNLCGDCINEGSVFMLAFVAPAYMYIGDFVDCISERFSDIQMLGGIVNHRESEYPDFHGMKSFVFTESDIALVGMATAVINSKKLTVNSEVIYVTQQVGKTYTVTESDGTIIRKVDGRDAVEWYSDVTGINLSDYNDEEDLSELSSSMFPMVKKDYGNIPWVIGYSPQSSKYSVFPDEKNPVLYSVGKLEEGQSFNIAYSSMQHTIEVCENVCDKLQYVPSDVIFAYSCISRMLMFKNCADWEFMPFKNTNLSGAVMIGEIGKSEGANRFCNYTTVIASLAESQNRARIDTSALSMNADMLYDNNRQIIEYLIKRSSIGGESEEALNQRNDIQNRLFTDLQTGLGNVTKYFYDIGTGVRDKICAINVKNQSLIRAFMSDEEYRAHSTICIKAISDFVGSEDYSCYFYNKTLLIISGSANVSPEDFVNKIKEVHLMTLGQKYNNFVPVCEFAIVINENDMLRKAETLLEKMKDSHECLEIYSEDSGAESENAEKMRMINIISDAIANDRVIPYFQGIRDNQLESLTLYESLMRIKDGNGKIYPPGVFLPVAKEFGFYNEISFIMIDKVLNIFGGRKERVTVNLEVNDIYNYNITHRIFDFLEKTPYPENFVFEITESEEIKDYQIVEEFTSAVIKRGGKIAIDDFGSGFSNFIHLLKIPAEYIKIDGEIIKRICDDPYALEVVELIAALAEKHNKFVIAEYIENDDIQQLINNAGIRYSQGYLYSKPERRFS